MFSKVEASVSELQLDHIRCRDYLVLHGTDVDEVPSLLREPLARPRQHQTTTRSCDESPNSKPPLGPALRMRMRAQFSLRISQNSKPP